MASLLDAETQAPLRNKPVCGNLENGIVVGKPRLFDERAQALKIRSMQDRLAAFPDPDLSSKLSDFKALSERALSDRVLLTPSKTGSRAALRAQVLLEFHVSINPRDRYLNAVAELELTVSSRGDLRHPAALIAQIPAGKDGETIALEKPAPTREGRLDCVTGFSESARDVTFAWQFHPTPGQDRVKAGTRELYALLTLPTTTAEDYLADIHIRTSWRPLGKLRHRTAQEFIDASSREQLWTEAIRYNQEEMELALRPKITGTRFVADTPGDLLIFLDGENFLADTTVMLGKTAIPAASLGIERERHIKFTVPADELLKHDLFLAGTPILDPRAQTQHFTSDPAWGLKIEYARAHLKAPDQAELRIKLKSRQRKRPLPEMIVNNTLVGIGGQVLTIANLETEPTDSDAVLVRFDVPTVSVRSAPRVTVARLFGGELYRDSANLVLEDDISVSKVNVLGEAGDDVILGIAGKGFTSLAVIQLADLSYTRWTKPGLVVSGSNLITLQLKREVLQKAKSLSLSQGFAQPVTIALPDLPERPRHHK